jgi:prepilin-type N-terminal cleavage/methylation domain-containing protein
VNNAAAVCRMVEHMSHERKNVGFTLIEMLVVIAIIAILAAMITGVGIRVAESKKLRRVDAEMHGLVMTIENYQHTKGFFPPDNGRLKTVADPDRNYAATNQLFYELTGPTYDANNNSYTAFDGSVIQSNEYFNAFNRDGVANSIEPRDFFNPPPKNTSYHSNFVQNAQGANVLVVPVDWQQGQINPWRYDSSSTNRHNSESFDLWAVFTVGSKTVTNKNW